jgi:hypothetical protein
MGSHLLVGMPRTGSYRRVIALLGDGAGGAGSAGVAPGDVGQIANATIDASLEGLELAKGDRGLGYCVYLMARVVLAAREYDFILALNRAGVPTPATISGLPDVPIVTSAAAYDVYDLTSGFTAAVDRHLRVIRGRTDIGEMAQLAAAECLSSLCPDESDTLFGAASLTVEATLRDLSTEAGFARLAHDFFARFIRRYLEYHLSRELSNHVGPGRRFRDVDGHNEFLRELDHHCRVSTSIMRSFAGDWYVKHRRLEDISPETAQGFAAHAVDKVRDALAYQEGRDVRG